MNILLASTVMVVAGASLLVAFTLRSWSQVHQARFNDMREQIEKRMAAIEGTISDMQAVLGDLRYKVEALGNQEEKRSSRDTGDF
jgi:hypothetical protein